MSKSRLRGGKKAHNKRVAVRNQTIKDNQRRFQKMMEAEYRKRFEEIQQQMKENETESGDTINEVIVEE